MTRKIAKRKAKDFAEKKGGWGKKMSGDGDGEKMKQNDLLQGEPLVKEERSLRQGKGVKLKDEKTEE